VSRGLSLSILKIQVEAIFMKKLKDLNVLIRAETNWIDHIVCSASSGFILATCVKLKGLLILEEHLKDHDIVLNNGVHNWVTSVGVNDIKLCAELKKTD